ncbi:IS66-like element accessory protein TnpA [Indioceanicola profundi]|uniref:IS66-like element accessory protein TnpA n=1 Tax=Indioceanicola profundi TaxID=2220096 RepID=UPI000E6AC491|nr:transposase [Indioceanicola profundi]
MAVPMASQRVEVITGLAGRRRFSADEKVRLVEEAFAPGVQVASVARRLGIDQSLLYRWRRQLFGDPPRLPAFTPVTVTELSTTAPPTSAGVMEVEFASGTRVRISGAVEASVVTAALVVLAERSA